MVMTVAEAVNQVVNEGGVVTNASGVGMLRVLSSGGEMDLAGQFALDLLRR